MGSVTIAELMYGVPLPGNVEEDSVDEVINDHLYLSGLGHSYVDMDDYGVRYLVTAHHKAYLGEPLVISADDLHPGQTDHWDAKLRVAWGHLTADPMPKPVWILAPFHG
jgi:hypothetical protein